MKRRYQDLSVDALEEERKVLEERLEEIVVEKEEKVREAFSRLLPSMPSEIWEMIFDRVENDHALLWLVLLHSNIPPAWEKAISRRKSLSFPPRRGKTYNVAKIFSLLPQFPVLRKIRIAVVNTLDVLYHESMKKIEEISFCPPSPGSRVRGRTNKLHCIRHEPTNALEKVVNLDVSQLEQYYVEHCLLSLPLRTKMNLTELNMDGFLLKQKMLDLFPNLYSLTLDKCEKGLHLNNHILVNKMRVVRRYVPLFETSRYIELLFRTDRTSGTLYSGELTYGKGGFSGMITMELRHREVIHVSETFQEETHMMSERKTYIVTGELKDGKAIGSFTMRQKGCGDVVILDKQRTEGFLWEALMPGV